jgi:hypothetical protein
MNYFAQKSQQENNTLILILLFYEFNPLEFQTLWNFEFPSIPQCPTIFFDPSIYEGSTPLHLDDPNYPPSL